MKRIVIKVGTSSVTKEDGSLDYQKIDKLVETIIKLRDQKKEIILVSSGAVSTGMLKLGISEKPKDVSSIQACAAVGQFELMKAYDTIFKKNNIVVSQFLLTKNTIENELSRKNIIKTFNRILEYNSIPIVNENDVISTYEIEFGNNDILAANVTKITNSNMLIILSDIDGLYETDPKENPNSKLIHFVNEINSNINKMSGDSISKFGTGGMISKIKAAQFLMELNIPMYITNGNNPIVILDILQNKKIGTLFYKSKGGY